MSKNASPFLTSPDAAPPNMLNYSDRFFANTDAEKRAHYLNVDGTQGCNVFTCIYCTLQGPRQILLSSHVERCREEYHKHVVYFREPKQKCIIKPEPVQQTDEQSAKEDKILEKEGIVMKTTPTHLEKTIAESGNQIDQSRCLYILSSHSQSRPKNIQEGMNFYSSTGEHMRICNISHAKKKEKDMIKALLEAGIEGTFPFQDKKFCAAHVSETKCFLRMEVGKANQIEPNPIKEFFFCNVKCAMKYLSRYPTITAWKKDVGRWKDEKTDKE